MAKVLFFRQPGGWKNYFVIRSDQFNCSELLLFMMLCMLWDVLCMLWDVWEFYFFAELNSTSLFQSI